MTAAVAPALSSSTLNTGVAKSTVPGLTTIDGGVPSPLSAHTVGDASSEAHGPKVVCKVTSSGPVTLASVVAMPRSA